MPGIFHQAGCCCGCPCLGATPGLTVSVVGGGDPVCGLANWPFSDLGPWSPLAGFSSLGDDWCSMVWQSWDNGGEGAYAAWLGLYYRRSTEKWCSWMDVFICGHAGTDADTCECPEGAPVGICPSTDVTGLVSCDSGDISGVFELAGDAGNPFEGYSFQCVIS